MNPMQRIVIAACLCAAFVPAQATKDLARAELLERQEGDLAAAEQAYRALLDGKDAGVAAAASLRLGELLWRLDRRDEAKAALALAKAAGGDVAAAANALLQGQGDDAKQAQERLVRARAIVAELQNRLGEQNPQGSNAAIELSWLGSSGAQALVEAIEDRLRRDPDSPPKSDWAGLLVPLLWQIGTAPAAEFLQRIAKDPHVAWRRLVATHALGFAADLRPAFLALLDDPDPAGEVQRCLEGVAGNLPTRALVEMLGNPSTNVRVAGLQGLTRQWREMRAVDREAILSVVIGAVRAGFGSAEPRLQHATLELLSTLAMKGPRAARHLVLELADRLPTGLSFLLESNNSWQLDDDELHLLATAARRFRGGLDGGMTGGSRLAKCLAEVSMRHTPEWTAASVDDLIDLLELGALGSSSYSPWAGRLMALASESQLLRLLRALPEVQQPSVFLTEFQKRPTLPDGIWPVLRDLLDTTLRTPPDKWLLVTSQNGRAIIGAELQNLVMLIGRTRADEAPAYLLRTVAPIGDAVNLVARTIVQLSAGGVGEPARAALRTLLVHEGLAENTLAAPIRAEVFAELARVGDEPAIARIPRAFELGMPDGSIAQLMAGPTADQRHGYDDAHLRAAWQGLLDGPAGARVLDDAMFRAQSSSDLLPRCVLDIALTHLAAHPDVVGHHYPGMLRSFGILSAPDVTADPGLHAALRGVLADADANLAISVFVFLRAEVAAVFADELHRLFPRIENPSAMLAAMRRAGLEPTPDEWKLAFAGYDVRSALAALPESLAPELMALVEDVARHGRDEEIRAAACAALAERLAAGAVPTLLQALRDPGDSVREVATKALERLRFHQEQQAYWQHAQAGVDVSRSSAAAKLVLQAGPTNQDRDQRLLAISALAALAAPETLPYLIDWSKDADAAVANAARAAAAAILDKTTPAAGK